MGSILGLLGLGKIQLAAVAAAAAVIGLLWFQNASLEADNEQLSENNAQLKNAVETQRNTIGAQRHAIGRWKAHVDQLTADMEALNRASAEASEELIRLDDIFTGHDLTELSLRKPGLIESRINTGTADTLRLLERATSGSTED